MNDLNSSLNKFQYSLKLNKLNIDILNCLALSLNIENEDNKTNLISKILLKLSQLKKEEFDDINNLIDLNINNMNDNTTTINNDKIENKDTCLDFIENKKTKKRTHLEIENEESQKSENEIKKKYFKKKFKGEKLLANKEKYYYIDENGTDWEFREKDGSFESFYFKCTTEKCNGFGMILRNDKNKVFKLTKNHQIPYTLHSYCNIKKKNQIFDNINFTQSDWDNKEFRRKYINWYFTNNNNASESECFTYIKTKFEHKILIDCKLLNNEIKAGKHSNILKNRAKDSILDQVINLRDYSNENITTSYAYDIINRKTK